MMENSGYMNDKKHVYNISIPAMCFLLFVFAPIEMYLMIKEDTWFSLKDFVGYLFIFFIVSIVFGLLIDRIMLQFIPKVWDRIVFFIYSVFLALYIQGNYIKADYGVLNGKPIEWASYKADGYKSLILFIAVILLAMILIVKIPHKRLKRSVNIFSICFMLLMLETLFVAMIKYNGLDTKSEVVCTTEGEWDYSSEENFIIIVLDSFDGRMMDDLLEGPESSEIKDKLSDFVFCRNTLSLYQMTDYSLLQIITGKEYLCEEDYDSARDRAYSSSELLKMLGDNGYETGIYAVSAIANDPSYANNWYLVRYGVDSHSRLIKYLYRFVGFRYLPFHMKKYCWFYPDDMNQLKLIYYVDKDGNTINEVPYDWENYMFNEQISEISVKTVKKCFKLYHLKGTHPIRNYKRDFTYTDEDVEFEETALSCIDMLDSFLNELRKNGVYDNSNILVMADHGETLYGDRIEYLNSPLLLYKGRGEHGAMRIDDSPCSYTKLDGLYNNIIEGRTSNDDAVEALKDTDRYTYNIIWADQPTIARNSVNGFERVNVIGDIHEADSYVLTDEKHLLEQ